MGSKMEDRRGFASIVVHPGATDRTAIDDADPLAEVPGAHRSGEPGGTGPDHADIKVGHRLSSLEEKGTTDGAAGGGQPSTT